MYEDRTTTVCDQCGERVPHDVETCPVCGYDPYDGLDEWLEDEQERCEFKPQRSCLRCCYSNSAGGCEYYMGGQRR
jgi:hypothetical protein